MGSFLKKEIYPVIAIRYLKYTFVNIMDNIGFVNPFDGPDEGLPGAGNGLSKEVRPELSN